ncbi:MAG TPA: succinylglutamate desuccinylase/aspartoacylase family protein [Devosia sp.]|nr:succinylglutamate desuccinylase/aspartoacylase family protein [Devosia sp.]
MTFERKTAALRGDAPGTTTELTWYETGPANAKQKVYLQAALHADEMPGTMLLHHLLPMLRRADDLGQLRARFTVMPLVNPLGMQNFAFYRHLRRYDTRTGVNYNRRWPDLFAEVGAQVSGRLTGDATENIATTRKAVAQWLKSQQPRTAAEQLRLLVLEQCFDADYVLDLHCDTESLPYIYTSPELDLQDLSDWMGSVATLTAADSGGGSFDEILPQLYRKLAAANPGKAVPMAAATATLEYRGQADVFDAIGADDARRLWGFLCGRGLIDADPGERPPAMPAAIPFEATEIVRVPRAGLLAYRVELAERVTKGQPIADLIALDGPEAFMARTPILAGTDGFVLSRITHKYVSTGTNIAKIVGTEPLPARRGAYLLED